MQIRAESGKSALPICNYSQILYQFLTFTQNLKRSPGDVFWGNIIFFYLSLSFSFGIKLLFLCSHLNIPGSGFV